MARKPNARVVLNRQALDKLSLQVADGMQAVGVEYITGADVPDAPPFGEGLIQTGGTITFVNGKKIGGFGMDGRQPRKPRGAVAGKGIVTIAGWGFPARLVRNGTVDTPAHGWADARRTEILPQIPAIIGSKV